MKKKRLFYTPPRTLLYALGAHMQSVTSSQNKTGRNKLALKKKTRKNTQLRPIPQSRAAIVARVAKVQKGFVGKFPCVHRDATKRRIRNKMQQITYVNTFVLKQNI